MVPSQMYAGDTGKGTAFRGSVSCKRRYSQGIVRAQSFYCSESRKEKVYEKTENRRMAFGGADAAGIRGGMRRRTGF